MADLNQYSLSRALGSIMKPIAAPRFGNFGLLPTTSSTLSARESYVSRRRRVGLSREQDLLVVKAFEETRDGASPDSLLWDKHLVRRYLHRCRELGLDAPDAVLARRVITIRKNSKRFSALGVSLAPTSRSEPTPSIVPRYAHLLEFALVRLRYRYGSSIDDILLEPSLGDQYESLCLQIAPELSPQQVRLGALYIRKTRFLEQRHRSVILGLNLADLEPDWTRPIAISELSPPDVPEEPGIFELCEKQRVLFVAKVDDIRTPLASLKDEAGPLSIVASSFWKAAPEAVVCRYLLGTSIRGVPSRFWERRLIHDLRPSLNWPMTDRAA
jgi:hypothetical protein